MMRSQELYEALFDFLSAVLPHRCLLPLLDQLPVEATSVSVLLTTLNTIASFALKAAEKAKKLPQGEPKLRPALTSELVACYPMGYDVKELQMSEAIIKLS